MTAHVERFAAGFGVALRVPARTPNTRAALGVAEFARSQGKLHAFRAAAMAAHWREGKDLEDGRVLAECARQAGLDPAQAVAAINDPRMQRRVGAMGRDAARAGVTGIPTFLVGRRRVVGCQPYQVLAAAAEDEGAARRTPPAP
jgi:predicted DsbA family dithiol-disulfide isomerase